MFGILEGLIKATVGVVIETPIALVKDVATLGGAITEEDEPYTITSLKKVVKNISDTTE